MQNDYLMQKIEQINLDLSILLDNIDPLRSRPAHIQRLREVSSRMIWTLEHFDKKPEPVFIAGLRVQVNQSSGFSRGSKGVIQFVEPDGERVWVLRDGSGNPMYFSPSELDVIE